MPSQEHRKPLLQIPCLPASQEKHFDGAAFCHFEAIEEASRLLKVREAVKGNATEASCFGTTHQEQQCSDVMCITTRVAAHVVELAPQIWA